MAVDNVEELSPRWGRDLAPHDSDFQRIASHLVQLAKILTGASGAAIAFRGEHGTICLACSGEGGPPLGAPVDITAGISRQCLDSGTALRCDDIATDGRSDPEIAQAIGIRAVAVVPIYSDGEIAGILEVFSRTPGVFTDHHLHRLQQLANWVGSAATPPDSPISSSNVDAQVNHPDLKLLVELEPAYHAFFRNLAGFVSSRSPAHAADSSSQLDGWNDVLVDSHLPWKRFLESVALHVVVVGMLAVLSAIWPRELDLSPRSFQAAHVTYYSLSQSFPSRKSRSPVFLPALHPAKPAAVKSVLPPPGIGEAAARPSHLPDVRAVAPAPDLSASTGSHRVNAPQAGAVPPPPDVRGSMTRPALIPAGKPAAAPAGAADLSVVPPPPSISDHALLTSGARGGLSKTGVQAVAPAPSLQVGANPGTGGREISLVAGTSQVVPPPPSLEGAGTATGADRTNSLASGGPQVVPPPPSVGGGGSIGLGGQGRGNSLAGIGTEGGLPPASGQGTGSSGPGAGGAEIANAVAAPPAPDGGGNRTRPVIQDLQLRVIGLAWAPPRSSYFSSFEVFIAEKWPKKEESQLIKLVYVFLPYQTRLSEYGFDDSKVRKLRVTRDPACDESLMQMMWPEGDTSSPGSHVTDPRTLAPADRNNLLPCYRTTADDYRRAVARSQ